MSKNKKHDNGDNCLLPVISMALVIMLAIAAVISCKYTPLDNQRDLEIPRAYWMYRR